MIFTALSRFRWAFCQLEALRHCLAPRVRHMLEELPETLDETYERILRNINKANRDLAHRLLQCLTVAVRPLRVAELAEVLAVDFGTASSGKTSILNTDWRWEDQEEAVLSTCSSLISVVDEQADVLSTRSGSISVVDEQADVLSTRSSSISVADEHGGQVVQFSHFSVKEFLTSSRFGGSSADVSRFHIFLEPAHTILAKACLGVLMRLGELVDEDNVEDKSPLARYAAEHWVDHARFENVWSHIREGIEDLFDRDKPYLAAWLQVHDIELYSSFLPMFADSTHKNSNSATPLYYAALCGFHDLAEQIIIKHPQQVNTTGGYYVSPLGAALNGWHLKIAQLLYEHGAEVDVQGRENCTPLIAASCSGHLEIVRWLLSCGASSTVRDEEYGFTPLHMAAVWGQVEVSRLLLRYKADIHAHDNKGRTPLHQAARRNQVYVARLLLEHGADVNARDNKRNTPLHLVSEADFPDVVRDLDVARLLVEHGANIDAEDDEGRTAFQIASEEGHHDFVKFLSDRGSK
jgi:ankyrin repeat protein